MTVGLTLCIMCQIDSEDFVNFVAFIEKINFNERNPFIKFWVTALIVKSWETSAVVLKQIFNKASLNHNNSLQFRVTILIHSSQN